MPLVKVILVSAATSAVLVAAIGAGPSYTGHPRGPWFTRSWDASPGGCARLDRGRIDDHLATANRWLVAELELDATQRAALTPVLTGAATWLRGLRDLCQAESDDARQTLTLLRELTGRSDAAVNEIATAFDGFYRSLDASQRQVVDGWLTWPHRRGVDR